MSRLGRGKEYAFFFWAAWIECVWVVMVWWCLAWADRVCLQPLMYMVWERVVELSEGQDHDADGGQ
jgi:hypothetical protein